MESHPEHSDAVAALDLVAASRTSLADRLITPWWYHPVLGLLVGGMVALHAVPSTLMRVLGLIPLLVGIGILIRVYYRMTGVWAVAYRSAAARPRAFGLAAVFVVVYLGSLALQSATGSNAVPILAGTLLVPIFVVVGRRVDRELRSELRVQA